MLVKSFSFLLEFKIPFELRFTTFSQKKPPKNPGNESLWLFQKSVTLLNLRYSLISVAAGNHKLVIEFIYYFLLATYRNKNNTVVQARTFAKVKMIFRMIIPSTRRNQTEVQTLGKLGPHLYPCEKPDPILFLNEKPS